MACNIKGTSLISCQEYSCLLESKAKLDSKVGYSSKIKVKTMPSNKIKVICP